MFADLYQAPGGLCSWLVVGLIAGWLVGLFMRGRGYGCFMDIVMGLLGSFIGGFLFSFFVEGVVGFWGSIGVAFVGGCVLVAFGRLISPKRD
ncbi:MAG: GlsB/YeaQ/YmgE family stress response membrane protein [Planctomycetia bacterium]|nr:GlsB/YeaQ/YmgE family stress response membrane protein [Planctomycetia bacterium]